MRSALRRMASTAALGPIARDILAKVTAAFSPVHVELENESQKHASRSITPTSTRSGSSTITSSATANAESHFKLFVVSAMFEGVPLLQRHRLVNDAIRGGASNLPCHALSISAKTPSQWSGGAAMHKTPECGGGGSA